MQNDNQPEPIGEPFKGSLEKAMSTAATLKEDGVFVVIYRHHVSPERVLGMALSLDGAMRVALDSEEIDRMSVEVEPGIWEDAPVSSTDKRCTEQFRWHDDAKVIWGATEFNPGHLGSQALEAQFQDESWGIYCHWTTNVRD